MRAASPRQFMTAAFAGWVVAVTAASSLLASPELTLARPVDQARFTATTFATGLSFPTSMAELADGSLLVAESAGGRSSAPRPAGSYGWLTPMSTARPMGRRRCSRAATTCRGSSRAYAASASL